MATIQRMSSLKPLIDTFGRVHSNLRVSVTDRCNIRCFYCMPAENVRFKPRHDRFTLPEVERVLTLGAPVTSPQVATRP